MRSAIRLLSVVGVLAVGCASHVFTKIAGDYSRDTSGLCSKAGFSSIHLQSDGTLIETGEVPDVLIDGVPYAWERYGHWKLASGHVVLAFEKEEEQVLEITRFRGNLALVQITSKKEARKISEIRYVKWK